MTDKRYLYRGFHADDDGKSTITLNGENIKGYWLYGDRNVVPCDGRTYIRANWTNIKESQDGCFGSSDNMVKVIPETVGQWVAEDKNDRDVFEGDRFMAAYREQVVHSLEWFYRMQYASDDIELVGNKWEIEK